MQGLADFADRYVQCPICVGNLTIESGDPPIQMSACSACHRSGWVRRRDRIEFALVVAEWPFVDTTETKRSLVEDIRKHEDGDPNALAIGIEYCNSSPMFLVNTVAHVASKWLFLHPSVKKILPDSAMTDKDVETLFETG